MFLVNVLWIEFERLYISWINWSGLSTVKQFKIFLYARNLCLYSLLNEGTTQTQVGVELIPAEHSVGPAHEACTKYFLMRDACQQTLNLVSPSVPH